MSVASSPAQRSAEADRLPTNRPAGCPFDPPPELSRFRAEEPVRRLTYPDGHRGWLVSNHELSRTVLADTRFSSRMELRRTAVPRPGLTPLLGRPAAPGMFIAMDPPEHTRYRRLLTGQFTVRRMRLLEPRIEQIAEQHLDAMVQAGPPADLVAAYALPIPSLVICELLGVPYADRDVFQRDTATLLRLDATAEQVRAASESVGAFMADLVRHKRAEPADDLLSGLIATGELTDEELAGVSFLLLVAGHETTANMLALGAFALINHRDQGHADQLAALCGDPTAAEHAVEELLRYLTIIQFGTTRTALVDIHLGDQLIRAGETLTLALPSANRDPDKFADPDTLDLTRSAQGHLAFGHGVHQCLGQQLARIEMRIGYRALFRRFPELRLAVPAEEVPLRHDMNIYGVHRLPVTW
ncbi:cytochrome P450 [Goodfellowiella coeruleoviolacea]|uniref:Cytochrome P450 n=1 Tax=Goodfellowiella coeruleoviolacea TaxID=334858 RepID=A0AAE3GGU0_9PSEU|nr:cytochrome P450 [Goodfellowiella coeruleoviolacea]MCP2167987.1 Cytochrome P450 [Goodfellowiella coeruleoviolacea]